jgi:acyl carrier protein
MNVQTKLIEVVSKKFPDKDVSSMDLHAPFKDQGFDSLDVSTILVEAELAFDTSISTSKMSTIQSLADLVDAIASDQSANG